MIEAPVDQPQLKSKRYDAFIVYSRKDVEFARRLQRDLEKRFSMLDKRIRGDKRRLVIFRDESDLGSSPDLTPSIKQAISSTTKLIAICSPNARMAWWVGNEIRFYRESHGTTDNSGITCVLVDGRDPVRESAIPEDLLGESREPAAVEFRPEKIDPDVGYQRYRIEDGLLQIYAALLDLDYVDLKNRHALYERERLKKQRFIISVVAIVFAVLAGVAYWEYTQAERQRRIALGNLDEALLGYAGVAHLELRGNDLACADFDLRYMSSLAAALPMTGQFATLWATFAEYFERLGDGYAKEDQVDRAQRSYRVSSMILDTVVQAALNNQTTDGWNVFFRKGLEVESGRWPGLVYMLSEPDSGRPTVMEMWQGRLKRLFEKRTELPPTNHKEQYENLREMLASPLFIYSSDPTCDIETRR